MKLTKVSPQISSILAQARVPRTFRGRITNQPATALSHIPLNLETLRAQGILLEGRDVAKKFIEAELREMHQRYQEHDFSIAVQDHGGYIDVMDVPGGIADLESFIEIMCLDKNIHFEGDVDTAQALAKLCIAGVVSETDKHILLQSSADILELTDRYSNIVEADEDGMQDPAAVKQKRALMKDIILNKEKLQDRVLFLLNQLLSQGSTTSPEIIGPLAVHKHYGFYFDRFKGFIDDSFRIAEISLPVLDNGTELLFRLARVAKKGWVLGDKSIEIFKEMSNLKISSQELWQVFKGEIRKSDYEDHAWVIEFFQLLYTTKILDRVIEPFAATRYLQMDPLHKHTVDFHSLIVLRELVALLDRKGDFWAEDEKVFGEEGKLLEEARSTFKEIASNKDVLPVLFMVAILHDAGKLQEPKVHHTVAGAEIIKQVLQDMGVEQNLIAVAQLLVGKHMHLADLFFGRSVPPRDPNDPQTVAKFARAIEGVNNLPLILAICSADLFAVAKHGTRATKNRIFNFMIKFMYEVKLAKYGDMNVIKNRHFKKVFNLFLQVKSLLRFSLWWAAFKHFWFNLRHLRYFNEQPDVIAEDVGLINLLQGSGSNFVTQYLNHPHRELTIFKMVTRSGPEVLWKLCFALSSCGLSIRRLDVFARRWSFLRPFRRFSIFKFFLSSVEDNEVTVRSITEAKERFAKLLNLSGSLAEDAMQEMVVSRDFGTTEAEVEINNIESERCTIIDIKCHDRLFLLYDIAKIISEYGKIRLVRVAADKQRKMETYHRPTQEDEKGFNSFYIIGHDGNKFKYTDEDRQALAELKERLSAI